MMNSQRQAMLVEMQNLQSKITDGPPVLNATSEDT